MPGARDRRARRAGRAGRERGSALLLFPAAVLVLCCLAAMAVDLSLAHLARRQAASLADAAASSAAGVLDEVAWRDRGEAVVDCARAAGVVRELAARAPDVLRSLDVTVDSCDEGGVAVSVRAEVGFVFARALPGAPRSVVVAAASTSELRLR